MAVRDLPHLWKGKVELEDYPYLVEILCHFGIAYVIPRHVPFMPLLHTEGDGEKHHEKVTRNSGIPFMSLLVEHINSYENEAAPSALLSSVGLRSGSFQNNYDDLSLFVPSRLITARSDTILKTMWEFHAVDNECKTSEDISDEEVCVFDAEEDDENDAHSPEETSIHLIPSGPIEKDSKMNKITQMNKSLEAVPNDKENCITIGRRFKCRFLPHSFFSRLTVQILRPHVWRMLYAWGDQRREMCGFVIDKMEKIDDSSKSSVENVEEEDYDKKIITEMTNTIITIDNSKFGLLRFIVEILPGTHCFQLLGRAPRSAAAALQSNLNLLQDNLLEFLKNNKFSNEVILLVYFYCFFTNKDSCR
jgi:hypothetical protein